MALLALIARRDGSVALFTLGGMMIAALAGALTSLIISLSPSPFALSEIVSWTMGALADRSWADVWMALPLTAVGLGAGGGRTGAGCDEFGRDDGALAGRVAARFGVAGDRRRGAVRGGGVAAAGVIGFVGLVVPHVGP
jgi:iron complex transport system permease protein